MATTENERKGILDFAAGTLATLGVEAAARAFRSHLSTAVVQKANELMNDGGSRIDILADVATLMTDADADKRKVGNQARLFFIEAQRRHEEGDLNTLLRRFPPEKADKRIVVLQMLGGLDNYEEFAATIKSMLSHDNVMQKALKIAERMESAGGGIINDDLRKIREMAASSLEKVANNVNSIAGAARPNVRDLTATLRRIR